PANDYVLAAVPSQRFFDLPRLRIGAIQHGDVRIGMLPKVILDAIGDPQGFIFRVRRFVQGDLGARAGFCPERLSDALGIVGNYRTRSSQDVFRGAIILLQPDDSGAGKIALEVQNVADVRAAPTINGLVLIANDGDVLALFSEEAHQFILATI